MYMLMRSDFWVEDYTLFLIENPESTESVQKMIESEKFLDTFNCIFDGLGDNQGIQSFEVTPIHKNGEDCFLLKISYIDLLEELTTQEMYFRKTVVF